MGFTQLIQFSFPLIDVLMIERLGPEALEASSMGGSIWFMMFLVIYGTGHGGDASDCAVARCRPQ